MKEIISVVVGFKNREIERVQQFIDTLKSQSNQNFELVFVDYGSDVELAMKIKYIVKKNRFCKYIYHDSRGRAWNRSHALNIGSKFAQGKYLYFTDIDLLFHSDYMEHLHKIKNKDKHIYTRVYYLPKNLKKKEFLFDGVYHQQFPLSHTSGRGILLVSKDVFFNLGGYDEYYSDWGAEDNDIYLRLENSGFKSSWTENENFPVYHMWHPPSISFFPLPDKWMDDSAYYYIVNQKVNKRNTINGFGKLLKMGEREIIKDLEENRITKTIEVYKSGSTSTKTLFYREIWKALNEDYEGIIKIIIPKFNFNNLSIFQKLIYYLACFFLYVFNSPFSLVYKEKYLEDLYFFPERDIIWFLRKLEKQACVISDYIWEDTPHKIVVYVKGVNNC